MRFRKAVAIAAFVMAAIPSGLQAITILSGPALTPATNAPLACSVQLSTDVPSRVKVSITDGAKTWERNFFDYNTNHSIPLLGFKPGRTNLITVYVTDKFRDTVASPAATTFITAPLPLSFPPIN